MLNVILFIEFQTLDQVPSVLCVCLSTCVSVCPCVMYMCHLNYSEGKAHI
jgi:hypothetical protein